MEGLSQFQFVGSSAESQDTLVPLYPTLFLGETLGLSPLDSPSSPPLLTHCGTRVGFHLTTEVSGVITEVVVAVEEVTGSSWERGPTPFPPGYRFRIRRIVRTVDSWTGPNEVGVEPGPKDRRRDISTEEKECVVVFQVNPFERILPNEGTLGWVRGLRVISLRTEVGPDRGFVEFVYSNRLHIRVPCGSWYGIRRRQRSQT